jgi:hypothetical protein
VLWRIRAAPANEPVTLNQYGHSIIPIQLVINYFKSYTSVKFGQIIVSMNQEVVNVRQITSTLILLIAASLAGCKAKTPEKLDDARILIARYVGQGRYDDAIKVAQDWMQSHPDDFLYDQVAIVYLTKASKDSSQRDESVGQAVANYEKDLETHKMGTGDIELYEAGLGFERAGDLSTHDSCLYYGRARKAFEDEVQFIQGDSYTAYVSTMPLAPLRQGNQKALERVKSKFDKASCK